MILPHTTNFILVLIALSMLCMGSWANTFKFAGKWRFELFYFDFAFGVMLLSIVFAATWGNMGFDGFGLMDSIMNAGKQEWAFGFGAGAVFFFANFLLMAVIANAGMAVAFPVGMAGAMIVGALLSLFVPGVNLVFLSAGCLLVAAAAVADAYGYNLLCRLRHEDLAKAGKAKSTVRPSGVRDIVMAVVGGLLLGA
ncbi:MAG TPA: hypothetical protein VMU19_14385, partial [Bryobacteraceae bacterium]|nr:hypothetical protein [Bryobacteraceae bacterium]